MQAAPVAAVADRIVRHQSRSSRENAPRLRANLVAPSYVETAFGHGGTGRSTEDQASTFDVAGYTRGIPLGRMGEPVAPTNFRGVQTNIKRHACAAANSPSRRFSMI